MVVMATKLAGTSRSASSGWLLVLRRNRHTLSAAMTLVEPGTGEGLESGEAKPFSALPGPKGLPFIGTLLQYTRGPYSRDKFHEALLARYDRYGPIFRENLAGETVVHVFDPDMVRQVYAADGRRPQIPALLEMRKKYRKVRDMAPGLGNTNGEVWQHLRSAVQRMMSRPRAADSYLPQVEQVLDEFVVRLRKVRDPHTLQIPDFYNEMRKWNLESSGVTFLERRMGCIDAGKDSYQQRLIDCNEAIFKWSLHQKFALPLYSLGIPTQAWKKSSEAEDYFFGTGQKLLDESVGQMEQLRVAGRLEEEQYSFLAYLLSRPELTYKDVSVITLSVFGDGLSSTVPALMGHLFCLAKNPKQQEILREEVQQTAPKDEPITPDKLERMRYLTAVVKEGFRFFAPAPEVGRVTQKDLILGGYHIPTGTRIDLNNNLLLRSPKYFKDPETFQPERWMRGTEHAQEIHPYLLLPFSHGPRKCVGMRFAEQEIKALLVKFMQNFKIVWPFEEPMGQNYRILMIPREPADFCLQDL